MLQAFEDFGTVGFQVLIIAVLIGSSQCAAVNYSCHPEMRLHTKLFRHYNPSVMPKLPNTGPIDIGIDLHLLAIEHIDEKHQTISIRGFLQFTWTDDKLKWDPAEYSNLTRINVKTDNIWVPDIALHRTYHNPTDLGQHGGNANIYHQGSVITWPYRIYTVACKINIAKFPFDEQTCSFDFVSWTNPNSVLVLNYAEEGLYKDQFVEGGEWAMVSHRIYKTQNAYGNHSWDVVSFELMLKRKALFHVLNMLLPVLCISVLNATCFVLPVASGERTSLSISIFLTLAVFLTLINSSMPESSDELAIFGVFVCLQLFGSAITVFLTTVSLCMFHRNITGAENRFLRLLLVITCVSKRSKSSDTHQLQHQTCVRSHDRKHTRKPASSNGISREGHVPGSHASVSLISLTEHRNRTCNHVNGCSQSLDQDVIKHGGYSRRSTCKPFGQDIMTSPGYCDNRNKSHSSPIDTETVNRNYSRNRLCSSPIDKDIGHVGDSRSDVGKQAISFSTSGTQDIDRHDNPQTMSAALDRLCLVGAICWHTVTIVAFLAFTLA